MREKVLTSLLIAFTSLQAYAQQIDWSEEIEGYPKLWSISECKDDKGNWIILNPNLPNQKRRDRLTTTCRKRYRVDGYVQHSSGVLEYVYCSAKSITDALNARKCLIDFHENRPAYIAIGVTNK